MDTHDELRRLYESIHACRQCPRVVPSLRAREVIQEACQARLALMAQAPSEGGVRKSGRHWVGTDGKLRPPGGPFLDHYLRTIGYSVDPANKHLLRPYTTNVLHCWTGRRGKRDRPPSEDELKQCKLWWTQELQLIRPVALVLLGKPAAEAFASVCDINGDFAAMLNERGVTMTLANLSLRRFVLPHPTAPYPNKSGLYADAFTRIGQLLRSPG